MGAILMDLMKARCSVIRIMGSACVRQMLEEGNVISACLDIMDFHIVMNVLVIRRGRQKIFVMLVRLIVFARYSKR